MLWLVWAALAFVVSVMVLGGWYVTRQGLAFWRTLKAFTALLGRASDVLALRADEASAKAGAAGAAVERVTDSVERLSQSLAYARIVAGAGGGAWSSVSALRGRMPRK
jgi:hypothetical protein